MATDCVGYAPYFHACPVSICQICAAKNAVQLRPFTMSADSVPKLFQPVKVGDITLSHRLVLAPLTRFRADEAHAHSDIGAEYYAQRGSEPGTLLIAEATFIAQRAGGYDYVPGVWSDEQVAAWKKVSCADLPRGWMDGCMALSLTIWSRADNG